MTADDVTSNYQQLASGKDERKSFELSISEDRLKLFLSVVPGAGAAGFSEDELVAMVSPPAATDLLDRTILADIARNLNKGQPCERRRIAKGHPAEQGNNGKILWLVKRLGTTGEVQADERGFVDYSQLHLFDNIAAGQKVARIYPPTDGKAGLDALGKPLAAANGQPVKFKHDDSLALEAVPNERYSVLAATRVGYAFQDGENLGIASTLTIRGDLDYHYGSIDFLGAVAISGDVHKGFSVRAGTSIAIGGSLEGDNMLSAVEEIRIKGTHFGGKKGVVSCQGAYQVAVAREVAGDIDGPIVLDKEAYECYFTTRDLFYGPAASIVGGEIRVVKGLEVRNLGNSSGKRTEVVLCVGPEATKEYAKLEKDIVAHEEAEKLITLHLGPYANAAHRIENLKEPQHTKLKKLYDKLQLVHASLLKLKTQKKHIIESLTGQDSGRVTVTGKLHGGVVIRAGTNEFICTDERAGPVTIGFDKEKNEVGVVAGMKFEKPVLPSENASKRKEKR